MDWRGFNRSANVEDRQGEFSPLAAMGIENPTVLARQIAEIYRRGGAAWMTPFRTLFPEQYGPMQPMNAAPALSAQAGREDVGVPFSMSGGF